ncbi:hypothetical protein Pan216_14390 [Planctomycetes bacterium Pan216]|uniref:Uncharacterized protein n=1 Tax=Kolteria novifilia TaxID=2527975 RepID=A0A518B0W8_9BACT|nr:hypothetical protein Pan216_14390 [Planctomycetes bacterium Pan216]
MRTMTRCCLCFCLLAGLVPVAAQDAEPKVVRLTLHPQAEPSPTLKYQLLPKFLDRLPGNAAVDYGKVFAEENGVVCHPDLWRKIAEWSAMPLGRLRQEDLQLVNFLRGDIEEGHILSTLKLAARREHCDWQVPTREKSFYTIILSEAQQMRSFGRLMRLRTRIQVIEREFAGAVETLAVGFTLGRNVVKGPTIIHTLVGAAIVSQMFAGIEDFIQQPGAPNLYWALTMLPRPLVDGRHGVEAEFDAAFLSLPMLRNVDREINDVAYWRRELLAFWKDFSHLTDPSTRTEIPPEVALTARCVKGYPMARRALIDWGLPEHRVEAMPVPQVILFYTARLYERRRDDLFKAFFLTNWREASKELALAEKRLHNPSDGYEEIFPLAKALLPALYGFRSALERSQQKVEFLRTIEAIRLHLAANDGELPESLDAMTVVPVPRDPFTEEPFPYQLEGEQATLAVDNPRGGESIRYVITVGR